MTMTNAEWCIKNNIQFKKVGTMPFLNPMYESQFVSIGYYDIGGNYHECYKGERLGDSDIENILSWLDMEHKESILDCVERKYLSAVIEPFKRRVNYICKVESIMRSGSQFIRISIGTDYYDSIFLPFFDSGTMYKGMEANKRYTLEELGL